MYSRYDQLACQVASVSLDKKFEYLAWKAVLCHWPLVFHCMDNGDKFRLGNSVVQWHCTDGLDDRAIEQMTSVRPLFDAFIHIPVWCDHYRHVSWEYNVASAPKNVPMNAVYNLQPTSYAGFLRCSYPLSLTSFVSETTVYIISRKMLQAIKGSQMEKLTGGGRTGTRRFW